MDADIIRAELVNESPKPWGFWATLGFSSAIGAVFVFIQTVVVIAFVVVAMHGMPAKMTKPFLESLTANGLLLSLASWITLPFTLGLIVLFVKLRKPWSVKDYLAMRGVSRKALSIWVGILVLLVTSYEETTRLAGPSAGDKFMVETIKTAWFPPLLWATLLIEVPLFEESFFRGFMFRGIQQSRLGGMGAVLITVAGLDADSHPVRHVRPDVGVRRRHSPGPGPLEVRFDLSDNDHACLLESRFSRSGLRVPDEQVTCSRRRGILPRSFRRRRSVRRHEAAGCRFYSQQKSRDWAPSCRNQGDRSSSFVVSTWMIWPWRCNRPSASINVAPMRGFAEALPHRRPDDQVGRARLVLQRDEGDSLGRARPLAHQHDAGHADRPAVGQAFERFRPGTTLALGRAAGGGTAADAPAARGRPCGNRPTPLPRRTSAAGEEIANCKLQIANWSLMAPARQFADLQFSICNLHFLSARTAAVPSDPGRALPTGRRGDRSQRAEGPGLGQPRDRRAAQARAAGKIVDRAERSLAPRLFDPFGVRGRHAQEHVEAEAEGRKGRGGGEGDEETGRLGDWQIAIGQISCLLLPSPCLGSSSPLSPLPSPPSSVHSQSRIVHIHRQHLDAVLAGVADQLGRGVKTHRLAVQQARP